MTQEVLPSLPPLPLNHAVLSYQTKLTGFFHFDQNVTRFPLPAATPQAPALGREGCSLQGPPQASGAAQGRPSDRLLLFLPPQQRRQPPA